MNLTLAHRRAGIVLHPTSLPGPYGVGIFDSNAYRFIDFMRHCHFKVWQVLPLNPVFTDGSPYNSISAFAGNIDLISITSLYHDILNRNDISEPTTLQDKLQQLELAFREFLESPSDEIKNDFATFTKDNAHWLEDFAVFSILSEQHNFAHWNTWPYKFRNKSSETCQQIKSQSKWAFDFICFQQYVFDYQWRKLKQYANSKCIELLGDIPIFVSDNSADVWSAQEEFKLDEHGHAKVVAGVPPDYFSETGQRWGNPIYNWEEMQHNNFLWWQRRLKHALSLYDIVRIDHFRGFAATWEIPTNEETAVNGQWVEVPGKELFNVFKQRFNNLPIIAEDLGIITEDVAELRDHFHLPGMKILHFAFDSDSHNPYLPHNHEKNCVVYTGTHDNDTTLGWYHNAEQKTKERMNQYLAWPGEQMPWPMIKCALASTAQLTMLPMQDILALDGSHRMNTPGTTEGNWQWRFQWHQLSHDLSSYLAKLNELYLRT